MAREPQLFPADTSSEAARVQIEVYRRMGPEKRLELALQLGDSLREFVAAGVRLRQPDWNEGQVRRELMRLYLGDELFFQVEQWRRERERSGPAS